MINAKASKEKCNSSKQQWKKKNWTNKSKMKMIDIGQRVFI
jgi:hypothetical protein